MKVVPSAAVLDCWLNGEIIHESTVLDINNIPVHPKTTVRVTVSEKSAVVHMNHINQRDLFVRLDPECASVCKINDGRYVERHVNKLSFSF